MACVERPRLFGLTIDIFSAKIDTRCQPLRPARHPAKEKAMTKNTTVTLDEAVANSAALAEQWASSCRK
jgi:hypothetical protein